MAISTTEVRGGEVPLGQAMRSASPFPRSPGSASTTRKQFRQGRCEEYKGKMKKTRSQRRTTGESNLETGASFLAMELETGQRSLVPLDWSWTANSGDPKITGLNPYARPAPLPLGAAFAFRLPRPVTLGIFPVPVAERAAAVVTLLLPVSAEPSSGQLFPCPSPWYCPRHFGRRGKCCSG